jgi:hypothetical protein
MRPQRANRLFTPRAGATVPLVWISNVKSQVLDAGLFCFWLYERVSMGAEDKEKVQNVGEDHTCRNSFDINIYGAGLKIREITGDLLDLFRFYSVPEEEYYAMIESIQDQIVGHIAGGVGREGKGFVTLYYGE